MDAEECEYARLTCDPSITVADLEVAVQAYFDAVGYRNLQEVIDYIIEQKCTWKTAAKAGNFRDLWTL